MPIYPKKCPQKFLSSYTPKKWNSGGSIFGVILRAPVLPIQQLPKYVLWGILDECIRPISYPNETDPKVTYNQEILKFVKIRFLQQKNHIFLVKQVMKTNIINFNQGHFRLYFTKKLFSNYQRFSAYKRKLGAMDLVHALCTLI